MARKSKKLTKIEVVRGYFKNNWKRLAIFAVITLALFGIYKLMTKQPKGIETTTVLRSSFNDSFTANGKIKAKREANLKFNSPGKVSWVGVAKGDVVRKWQGVVSLDSVALNAAYQQALNNLRNFDAQADSVLDSVQEHSFDENFATRAERTLAETNKDNAFDAVLTARNNLKNAVVVSPIAGTVVDVNGLVTGLTLTGADLEAKFIRVVDLTSLYFAAEVDEIDFANVEMGQEVEISVDAYPDKVCSGKVGYINKDGKETSGGVVTIGVDVEIEDCDVNLASGLNGQASFVTQNLEDVLVIPKKYIVVRDGDNYVWRMAGTSMRNRELVPVTLGESTSTRVVVEEGLSEGDQIILIP